MTTRSIRWYERAAVATLLLLTGVLIGVTLTPAEPAPVPVRTVPVAAPAPTFAAMPAALAAVPDGASIPDVAAAVLPSVVNVESATRRGPGGSGSGVIVDRGGVILTNHHVASVAGDLRVTTHDGESFPAKVVGSDAKSDVAVLKLVGDVPDDLVAIPFGDSDSLRIGETVLAVGNPFGLSGSVTMGIVSALGRGSVSIVDYEDFIQTDAAINPGNSGGALVNLSGQLVGINTAILSRTGGNQGIGFAIPTTLARPIMESLLDNGRVDRGWLGVSIRDAVPGAVDFDKLGLDEDLRGVLVAGFVKGSPAEEAGLRRHDVILAVDGHATDTSARLRNRVAHTPAGRTVSLDVVRQGEPITIEVVLDPLPSESTRSLWR